MNRDDLLKKCVDRGVADESSVEAVSHLFYMYLLTALQKGQRVEVPNFGTFGTRVVGVKRLRRMPFFEVERDLAEKVNDRYRDLRYLVVGRYELAPVEGDQEYEGKEAPHDAMVDEVGKEMVLDTHRDVTIEEYERTLALSTQAKEKEAMPKLNLKDMEMEEPAPRVPDQPVTPPAPPLPPVMQQRRGPSVLVQVFIALCLLAAVTFALNTFGVIHLWGPKTPKVTQTLPTDLPPPAVTEVPPPAQEETPTPLPAPGATGQAQAPAAKPETLPSGPAVTQAPVTPPPAATSPEPAPPKPQARPAAPPSTGGEFTVQVSSWLTMTKANQEIARLKANGLDAFVSRAIVEGETRYRVRVGRYATQREAGAAAAQLSTILENGIWVARERSN